MRRTEEGASGVAIAKLQGERGASAVEFAIIAPLLVILVFGIIQFGIAFLHIQTLRSAVREGGRMAAVGGTVQEVQTKTAGSSLGYIQAASDVQVDPHPSTGPVCTAQTIGDPATVQFSPDSEGGITVRIPLMPAIPLHPEIKATFRCEV
jgi:Flp pilus assembly protein TadG